MFRFRSLARGQQGVGVAVLYLFCNGAAGVFKTADAAYMLAFAIIMLNTDAHNPMVDDKMSVEDFVMMNAAAAIGEGKAAGEEGGDEGGGPEEEVPLALPLEELHGIYERIKVGAMSMWGCAGRGKVLRNRMRRADMGTLQTVEVQGRGERQLHVEEGRVGERRVPFQPVQGREKALGR